MAAIGKEIGLAQTLSISRVLTKLQEIHKSDSSPALEESSVIETVSTEPVLENKLSESEGSVIEK